MECLLAVKRIGLGNDAVQGVVGQLDLAPLLVEGLDKLDQEVIGAGAAVAAGTGDFRQIPVLVV
jgi:hypothetical protein